VTTLNRAAGPLAGPLVASAKEPPRILLVDGALSLRDLHLIVEALR
jgi:hypothetical protein